MWKVCHSAAGPLVGFLSVHSSTELSFIVMSTRLWSNVWSLTSKDGGLPPPAGCWEKRIVRRTSTFFSRRSGGSPIDPLGIWSLTLGPVETIVSRSSLGVVTPVTGPANGLHPLWHWWKGSALSV